MSYTVLARKYRPQTFEDMVGQEHVGRTLANAITSNRVAHAFLFTGARGVGKTTTARVLARSLNCENGPIPTPCGVCAQCQEIAAGVDMDVLEIDGASNNSVEDVRRLQESIPYRPARDRFKIVIVDEVHMLSTGAFNAFLKTLEEPPAHVKFIFATTESHKVPVTIRSRCQRYDFRLIPQGVIAERVRSILKAESIHADDATVALVATEAAGSMRDALTLLDQAVAFGGNELRGTEVAQVLGIADRALVNHTVSALAEGDGQAALRAVDELASRGLDMLHFSKQVLQLTRDLVVLRIAGAQSSLVELVEEERKAATELASRVDVLELERLFASAAQVVEEVGRSAAPRTALEMGLVRIATRPKLESIATLVAELEDLAQKLGSGSANASTPTLPASGRSGGRARTAPNPPAHTAPDPPAHTAPNPPAHTAPDPPAPPAPPTRAAAPRATEPPMTAPAEPSVPAMASSTLPPVPAAPAAAPPSKAAPKEPVDTGAWERVVAALRETRPALAAVLEHAIPLSVSGTEVVLGFPEGSFFSRQAETEDAREGLASACETVLGHRPELRVRTLPAGSVPGASVAQVETQQRAETAETRRRAALKHPRVVEAMQVFPEAAASVEVEVDQET